MIVKPFDFRTLDSKFTISVFDKLLQLTLLLTDIKDIQSSQIFNLLRHGFRDFKSKFEF